MTVYRIENMEHGVAFYEFHNATPKDAAEWFIGSDNPESLYAGCTVRSRDGWLWSVFDTDGENVDDLMVDQLAARQRPGDAAQSDPAPEPVGDGRFNFAELNKVIDFLCDELERGMGDAYGLDHYAAVQDFIRFYRVTDEQAFAQRSGAGVTVPEWADHFQAYRRLDRTWHVRLSERSNKSNPHTCPKHLARGTGQTIEAAIAAAVAQAEGEEG